MFLKVTIFQVQLPKHNNNNNFIYPQILIYIFFSFWPPEITKELIWSGGQAQRSSKFICYGEAEVNIIYKKKRDKKNKKEGKKT